MPKSDTETRLTGVFLKMPDGKFLRSGNIKKQTLREAIERAGGGDEFQLTVWLNVKSVTPLDPSEKFKENSPDGSIVLDKKFVKTQRTVSANELTEDDIPF